MEKNKTIIGVSLIFLEVTLLLVLFTLIPNNVIAGIGGNTTVTTNLTIGNVWPEILEVFLNEEADIVLSPATTTTVYCTGVLRDYNGEGDFNKTNATLFDTNVSTFDDTDDNNHHYTNSSCNITNSFGSYRGYTDDVYHALANCSFEVEYYANPEVWDCRIELADDSGWLDNSSDTVNVSELLALGLPDTINYGLVNATFVSDENITNITNYGNTQINLTLEGYGVVQGDGLAMDCTIGNIGTIDADYQRYNLTASNPGALSLSEFEANYTNLTSVMATKQFELDFRQDDGSNEAIKESYWRIYVPKGVAGTCSGSIIFGATQAIGA